MPVRLYETEQETMLMELSPAQLAGLQAALEEEFEEDHDYYLTPDTLDYMAENGVDAALVERLRAALGDREGFDVFWRTEA
jgi:hypothetical protein